MGRQKLRKPRRERPSVTVHAVRTPEDLAAAMAKMFPEPKSGDWRPDVIGVEKLSVQPGPDGWPLVNGHRITEEMCAAIQIDRPDQAEYFVYGDIIEMTQELSQTLGTPQFNGSLFGIDDSQMEFMDADRASRGEWMDLGGGMPPSEEEMQQLFVAWDLAIETGLMLSGAEVNYRTTPEGDVISDAIGMDGEMLVDGRELTPEWGARLRQTKPAFVGLIDIYETMTTTWTRISDMGPCEHSTCGCAH